MLTFPFPIQLALAEKFQHLQTHINFHSKTETETSTFLLKTFLHNFVSRGTQEPRKGKAVHIPQYLSIRTPVRYSVGPCYAPASQQYYN